MDVHPLFRYSFKVEMRYKPERALTHRIMVLIFLTIVISRNEV